VKTELQKQTANYLKVSSKSESKKNDASGLPNQKTVKIKIKSEAKKTASLVKGLAVFSSQLQAVD